MTTVAAVDHIVVGWDLSGCRFCGADLDGLQVCVGIAPNSSPPLSLKGKSFTLQSSVEF